MSQENKVHSKSICSRSSHIKCQSSLMYEGCIVTKGFNSISMKLLRRCVGAIGPATMGRAFKSVGLGIWIYLSVDFLTPFIIEGHL